MRILALLLLPLLLSPARAQSPEAGYQDLAELRAPAPRPEAENAGLRAVFDALPGEAARGVGVKLIMDNQEGWLSRWEMLARTRSSLDVTYYIYGGDVFSMSLFGGLIKAALDGVQVRLMVDANGNALWTKELLGRQTLKSMSKHAALHVKVYKPLYRGVLSAAWKRSFFDGICSNHDKIFLSDGEWGITGGRNLSMNYFTDPADHDGAYRDADVLLRGSETSTALKAAFDREYQIAQNSEFEGNHVLHNWIDYQNALLLAYKGMDLWLRSEPADEAEAAALRASEVIRTRTAERLVEQAVAWLEGDGKKYLHTQTFAGVTYRGGSKGVGGPARRNALKHLTQLAGLPKLKGALRGYDLEAGLESGGEVKILDRTSLAATPGSGHRARPRFDEITPGLLEMMEASRREIVMENQYMIFTREFLDQAVAASRRGAKIRFFTNSPESRAGALTQAYFQNIWPEILAEVAGMKLYVMAAHQKLHTKVFVFDDVLSVVGSYNLDLISEDVNSEVVAAVWSPGFAAAQRQAVMGKVEDGLGTDPPDVLEYTIDRGEGGEVSRYPAGHPKAGQVRVTFGQNDHHVTTRTEWALRWAAEHLKLPSMQRIVTQRRLPPMGDDEPMP